MSAFITINHEGTVFDLQEQPITDRERIFSVLDQLYVDENHTYKSILDDQEVFVEAYSFALLVEDIIEVKNDHLIVECQFGYSVQLNLNQAYLDYKDRFIIYDSKNRPILLGSKAQNQLFDLADEYSDESITFAGKSYQTPDWIGPRPELSEKDLWSKRYTDKDMGWDMGQPSPSLVWAVDKLKLPKMRIAVLGSGVGHDAFYLSEKGHKVTGFDFSSEAIAQAQVKYPANENLQWVCHDVFQMADSYRQSFDLIVEHTCFCAIDPVRRQELVSVWKDILTEEGQILGVFFVMPKSYGPPYGATEQEIYERLEKNFRPNFWLRSRASHPRRLGRELIVLCRKNR